MTENEVEVWDILNKMAADYYDNRLTIMKLPHGWRIGFYATLSEDSYLQMEVGNTFHEAAERLIMKNLSKLPRSREPVRNLFKKSQPQAM